MLKKAIVYLHNLSLQTGSAVKLVFPKSQDDFGREVQAGMEDIAQSLGVGCVTDFACYRKSPRSGKLYEAWMMAGQERMSTVTTGFRNSSFFNQAFHAADVIEFNDRMLADIDAVELPGVTQ